MQKLLLNMLAIGAFVAPAAAQASIVLDGSGFGSPSATVTYDPAADTNNFATPGTTTSGAAYNIYTRSDAMYAYVLVSKTGTGVAPGDFANLYFGTGSSAASGSDLGFEVTNSDVFIPGATSPISTAGTNIQFADLGSAIEFAVPFSYLENDPQNLGFDEVTAADPDIVLRLSQSYGFSVAGGSSYGADRLGLIVAPFSSAVPEPGTWAMMLVGIGVVGASLRRRCL